MAGAKQPIHDGILESDLDANGFSILNLNLGVFGFQPLDADLTAIAALTTLPFGRGALGMLDAAAFRSYIGAQAYDADLDTWATKTPYAGVLTIATGKTFNVTGTLTLAGTDASTLNIGGGGTLGTAAYTAATAYEPASGTKNVMNYGALADDIADDTGAIIAALAAAGTYGRIFIPKGTYYIAGQLNPPIGCDIIGAGMDSTFLHVKATSNPAIATIFCSLPGQRWGLLQDFAIKFDQPNTVGMGWADLIQYKPAIIGCPTLRLTNIAIWAAWDGIDFSYYSGSQAHLDNVRIGAFNNGIRIANTTDNLYASKLWMANWGMGIENQKIYFGNVTPNPTGCGINIIGACTGLYISQGIFMQSGPAIKTVAPYGGFVQCTGVWFDGQSRVEQGAGVINLIGCNLNGGGPNKVSLSGGTMNISAGSVMFYQAGSSAVPLIDVSGGSLNVSDNQFVYDNNGESDDTAIRQTGGIMVLSGNVFNRGETGSHTFTKPTIVKTGGAATIVNNRSSALLGGTSTFLSVSGDISNDKISGNVAPGWVTVGGNLDIWAGITPGANVGTFLATPTLANFNTALSDADVAILSANTFTGAQTNSTAGAASAPANYLTGAWFTGGTGTTTLPHLLLQATGTTASTTWSTAGTGIGVNAVTGFVGNLMDLRLAGVSALSVTSAGTINLIGNVLTSGNIIRVGTNGRFDFSGRSAIQSPADGVIRLTDSLLNTFTGLDFGVTSANGARIGFNAVNGFTLQSAAGTATWNDPSTAASGTVANRYLFGIAAPTLSSTNATVTYTKAATFSIGGSPTAGTNVSINTPYALDVISGDTNLGGNLTVGGTITNATLASPAFSGTVSGTPAWTSNQAITLSTAAQPNITSLGVLTSLIVAGGTSLSAIEVTGASTNGANIKLTKTSGVTPSKTLRSANGNFEITNNAYSAVIFSLGDTGDISIAGNYVLSTSTGTKLGTATTQKLSFWNATPVVQPTATADASGGAIIDSEARTALNGLLSKLRTIGIIAT